jgi:hypothetical protein
MNRLLQAASLVAVLAAGTAFASNAQNHQCVKDGQVLKKTKAECHKDGGKWEKLASAKPAPAAKPVEPAPAPKPADPAPTK